MIASQHIKGRLHHFILLMISNEASNHVSLSHPRRGPLEHFLHFFYQNKGYRLTIFGYMVLPPEGLFLPTMLHGSCLNKLKIVIIFTL